MSQLPLRAIEAFVAAAREGSLARAALVLSITVPAVSRRVQILEQQLGVRLFHRLPRGLALTSAGERYFAELGPAWEVLQKATAAARISARRPLRISVIPTFAANWLLPRLARDGMRPAGMEIELETSADYVDLEIRQDIDCALRLGRGPWPGLIGRSFLPIEAYPVASPAFCSGHSIIRKPHHLLRHTLIGSTHQPDFWPEWFRLGGRAFEPAAYRSYDNLQLVYEAAAAGLGIAIGLDPLVRPYLESRRLVRLDIGSVMLSRSFHIVRRKGRPSGKAFERFSTWLQGEAQVAA
ncbi:LysR family transcriptional regulator, glycine cleavage system transcriptional activator [Enhydrobacter aerosaccus]|uniref:LysR family transcriptional regulator, glycine cleavage system transcriptional activator n=1 Tax=Enhydrobacter aerosaccus TaxID=225324 RepID=A0A1T4NGP4_9HYPH|nr:LysR substrate-binding domain-containing protein [Enhydrobacter aerosaccus]SJZ78236.1 LysR family transcriptional regulator, glycine cleavage system transcriptional activator [Enhydrobacter aerosaccus]